MTGVGAHGAFPHKGIDPIVVASEIVLALQRIVSRTIDPLDQAVISVTKFNAGFTTNVISEEAVLAGTARAFRDSTVDTIEAEIERIANGIAAAHGASIAFTYDRRYPATVNTERETEIAARAAADIIGEGNVLHNLPPLMGLGGIFLGC